MKNLLLFICLLALPLAAFSQNRALNKFYREHKKENGVQNMKVPGWLARLGLKIAKGKVTEPEEKMALELARKIGTTRIMFSEDGDGGIPQDAVKKLAEDLRRDHFDDLIMIREGSMDVKIMIREQGGVIENLLVLYNDPAEGEMVFVSMKANLRLEDLGDFIKTMMKKEMKEIFEEPPAEPEAPPVQ
ncbi:MAG: DUF4252 domain-containing protein [Bacteroidota bacterium]